MMERRKERMDREDEEIGRKREIGERVQADCVGGQKVRMDRTIRTTLALHWVQG